MQTASAGFAAATLAGEQTVDKRVIISFPAGVQASFQDVSRNIVSITPRRSVTSALPEQTTLIAGVSTAVLTVVLAGMLNQATGMPLVESQTIDWLMRPNDPTSPMYRQTCGGLTITVQMGYWLGGTSPEWLTIYTGTIDTPAVSDGYVTLTCRDGNSTIINPASFPPVMTQDPYNAALTSEYAMEHALRYASPKQYLTRPAERAHCVLSVGYRSSMWPDVGVYQQNATVGSPAVFAPGNFGSAFAGFTGFIGNPGAYDLKSPILQANSVFIEGFISNGCYLLLILEDANVPAVQFLFNIDPAGAVYLAASALAGVASGDTTWSVSTSGKKYFGAQISWAVGTNTVSGTFYLDNLSHAFSFSVLNGATAVNRPAASIVEAIVSVTTGGLEGLQVTTETAGGSSLNNNFTPTAILDPSLNPLTVIPDVTGQTVPQVLQDIATAEAGVFLFDEVGAARFYNRETIRTQTSAKTVTSGKSLMSLDTQQQMSLCATHIQVPYTPRSIQPYTTVWNTGDTIVIGAGSKYVTIAQPSNPIVNLATSCGVIPTGGLVSGSGYRASRGKDGGGGEVTNLVMVVSQIAPTSVYVTVRNPNSFPVWLVSPKGTSYPDASDGLPMLALGAQPAVAGNDPDGTNAVAGGSSADAQWPDTDAGGAISNATFGEVLYQAPDSEWRQDGDAAQDMADHLLSDLHYPKVLYRNVTTRPDPQLQLLDAITLADTDVSQTNSDVLILGSYPRYSAGEWAQDLDIVDLYRPGAWELGVSTLGVDNYLF